MESGINDSEKLMQNMVIRDMALHWFSDQSTMSKMLYR